MALDVQQRILGLTLMLTGKGFSNLQTDAGWTPRHQISWETFCQKTNGMMVGGYPMSHLSGDFPEDLQKALNVLVRDYSKPTVTKTKFEDDEMENLWIKDDEVVEPVVKQEVKAVAVERTREQKIEMLKKQRQQ
jgi:hypothetical protein